ncbi:hypothetical protein LJC67_08015, partial [Bacteroidales bacterium OttesenSCG-928-A14]|nr:hypothetical protein [Bacteroidales bacterium OttesenSCG-928-A14]
LLLFDQTKSRRENFNGNILHLRRNDQDGNILHSIMYDYENYRNRLVHLEAIGINNSDYTYDKIGNLQTDGGEGIISIHWNMAGKVTYMQRRHEQTLDFFYSATGQRQVKALWNEGEDTKYTYYLHDATGNIMATYTLENSIFKVGDLYLYGSNRLGTLAKDEVITSTPSTNLFTRSIGDRQFELTDHLGNVTAVISDRKTVERYSAGFIEYSAVLHSYTDYYPFGYPIAERSSNGTDYRFGFNGQEKDDEIYGEGASYTAEFWQYDSRLGRRWNVDPVLKPWESPYATFGGNPILMIDPDGKKVKFSKDDDVSRKDFREMKKNIRELRKHSSSFNAMYKDLKSRKEIFTYNATSKEGSNAKDPYNMQIGINYIGTDPDVFNEPKKHAQMGMIAHETGHTFRKLYNLDPENVTFENSPNLNMFNLKWQAYHETTERGAMHIENIVRSELQRSRKYSDIKLNPIYSPGLTTESNFINSQMRISIKMIPSYNVLTPPRDEYYYKSKNFDIYEELGIER